MLNLERLIRERERGRVARTYLRINTSPSSPQSLSTSASIKQQQQEEQEMLKKEGPGKAGKLEAGVAEINNSLCKAMIGLVLSEEAVRSAGS